MDLLIWEGHPSPLEPADSTRAEYLGISPASLEHKIESGLLVNYRLKILYPIVHGVPRLLTFPTQVTRDFMERWSDRLRREFPEFSLPHEDPMPGETEVLRTFSTEWENYEWNDQAYWYLEAEQLFKTMDFMLDLEHSPVDGMRVLEVGIGIGGVADNLAATHNCEVVGIDLSYAVDPAYKQFGSRNSFFHVVQASVFKPPFPEESFDFVFSQGVLHHTFSTRVAVDCITLLPNKGGRLYVWVYSPFDERRTLLRRILYGTEVCVRPLVSRLPTALQTLVLSSLVPLYMLHQNGLVSGAQVSYGWREAIHAARDRFTPRYAHRHTNQELHGWLSDAGYSQIRCTSDREHPSFVPISFMTGTGIEGIREHT